MIPDIVLDTNVLVHAGNPSVAHFTQSVNFLNKYLNTKTLLCVDEGFDFDQSKNRSLIGHEYIKYLRAGSFGYNVIVTVATSLRIKPCSRNTTTKNRKKINQLVRNKRDRTFLRVTCNSDSKIFTSHDYTDFPNNKRRDFYSEIKIRIFSAQEAQALL